MAAFNRLKKATYQLHESVSVDTQDNEDHTFCGIMFPIKCKDLLPVDHISIRSLAVRGQLGPMTVWISKEESELPARNNRRSQRNRNNNNTNTNNATSVFCLTKSHWNKIYEKDHDPSQHEYATLELDQPIIMKPGQIKAIYIHSTLPGDQAIVYDNSETYFHRGHFGRIGMGRHPNQNAQNPRYEDSMIQIHTGRAHVSNSIFGQMPIWGWGNAWRDQREFVGQVHYGAVYKLWNPETQIRFGPHFKDAYFNLKLCQTRWESPISKLPDECIFYILNMCRWDWFKDCQDTMKTQKDEQKRKEKQRLLEQRQRDQQEEQRRQQEEQQRQQEEAAAEQAQVATAAQGKPSAEASVCCKCPNRGQDDNDSVYEDAVEELGDNSDKDGEVIDEDFVMFGSSDEDDDDDDDYDDEEEVDEDDEDWDSDDAWEAANGYRADHNVFRFVDPEQEMDEEEEQANEEEAHQEAQRQRSFLRIHVLRALARQQDDDEDVVDMNLVF